MPYTKRQQRACGATIGNVRAGKPRRTMKGMSMSQLKKCAKGHGGTRKKPRKK